MTARRRLFVELRRRNVFRAATFYAASAWLLVEVVTQLVPVFDIPGGVVRWIVIAAVIGFPFAMLFSWLYEWTPAGVRRESEVPASESIAHLTGKQLDRMIIAVLALAVVLLLVNKLVLRPRIEALADRSIAVLPLVSEGGDAGGEYFSDGLSENLIAALSRFHGLKVISRNSSFQFRDSKEDRRKIGRKLGAAHLLEGRVRREGGRVRIVLEMVRAADGETLWTQRYERAYHDLFALQDEIAATVAGALQAKLLAADRRPARGDRPPGGSLDAYNAYLQGKFYEARNSEADFRKAIHHYQQAIASDARYAEAHAALSLTSTRLAGRFLEGEQMRMGYAQAGKAAQAALSIDPGLAAAYLARGKLRVWADFDWTGGAADYRRALQLAPGSSPIKTSLGEVEAMLGHPQRAEVLTRDALAADPLNAHAWHLLATYLMSLGRLDEAEQALSKAAEVQPGMFGNQEQLAIIGILRGDAAAALRAAGQEHAGDWRDAAMARALQLGDDRRAADLALDRMIETQAGKAAYQIAQVQALRKDPDKVFEWLERARASRDPGIGLLLYDPLLRPYRDDPRFAAFCRKVGLPVPASVPSSVPPVRDAPSQAAASVKSRQPGSSQCRQQASAIARAAAHCARAT